jgi:hypothetical protein
MLPMRSLLATVALCAVANFVHASPPQTVLAHVAIPGSGEFDATVIKTGDPTTLWVHERDGAIELKLAYFGPDRFHYEIKRNGDHAFSLSGVVSPPTGKPLLIGYFPSEGEKTQGIMLWLTDR